MSLALKGIIFFAFGFINQNIKTKYDRQTVCELGLSNSLSSNSISRVMEMNYNFLTSDPSRLNSPYIKITGTCLNNSICISISVSNKSAVCLTSI